MRERWAYAPSQMDHNARNGTFSRVDAVKSSPTVNGRDTNWKAALRLRNVYSLTDPLVPSTNFSPGNASLQAMIRVAAYPKQYILQADTICKLSHGPFTTGPSSF